MVYVNDASLALRHATLQQRTKFGTSCSNNGLILKKKKKKKK